MKTKKQRAEFEWVTIEPNFPEIEVMKRRIVDFMASKGGKGISFVELETIEGFRKEGGLFWENDNVVFWIHMTHSAIVAMQNLITEDVIITSHAPIFVYLIDGKILKFPVCKNMRKEYKTLHWLPLTFSLGKV